MTREEARKAAEVMLAYADGKEIEYSNGKNWIEASMPEFKWGLVDYRIKQKPTYRPFKDKKECWAEMQKHQPFGWIKYKSDEHLTCLAAVDNGTDFIRAYETVTFADGTPFGIKEDE